MIVHETKQMAAPRACRIEFSGVKMFGYHIAAMRVCVDKLENENEKEKEKQQGLSVVCECEQE